VSGATRTGSRASLVDWASEKAVAAITITAAVSANDFRVTIGAPFMDSGEG
jgi:hypothetical protein